MEKKQFYTVFEAAKLLHQCDRTIRRWCQESKIPGARKAIEGARKWLIPRGYVETEGEDVEYEPKQATRPALQEEAQREHLAEVRRLIEEWRDLLYIPDIAEVGPDSSHPISNIEGDTLFRYVKEHLPFPILWVNHWLWTHWIRRYLVLCEEVILAIRRDWSFATGAKTNGGDLIWAETKRYHYHRPIVLRISDELLRSTDSNWSIREGQNEHEFRVEPDAEKSGSHTNMFSLSVDGILVGKCFDVERAIEQYKAASDRHLSDEDTTRLIIIFNELRNLRKEVAKSLHAILSRRDYMRETCSWCPIVEVGGIQNGTSPKWATQTAYEIEVKKHSDALAVAGKVISANMAALIRFKQEWSGQGECGMEGDIVDGAWVVNPMTDKAWPVWREEGIEQVDSLVAGCLLAHLNHQFPQLAFCGDWREVNFENLEPEIVNKLNALVRQKAFEFCPNCPVCWALKTAFGR